MDITQQIQDILLKAGNAINGRDAEDLEDEGPTYDSIVEWKSTVLMIADDNGDTTKSADSRSTHHAKEPFSSEDLRQQWYKTGHDYYEDESNCPATVDGVLGGFANLSPRDLKASEKFLKKLQRMRPEFKMTKSENGDVDTYALECGAGELLSIELFNSIMCQCLCSASCLYLLKRNTSRNRKSIQRITLAPRLCL